MLSKNKANFIVSLQDKKAREKEKLFIVEGDKIVREFILAGAPIKILVGKPEFLSSVRSIVRTEIDEVLPVNYDELKKLSSLKTPHNALAVVRMSARDHFPPIENKLVVALDFVQDPGNLGTIIRAAAWFGIKDIFCSENCVDVYNSKVIQASMGAILHVKVHYTNLADLFIYANKINMRVYGTSLQGQPIYDQKLDKTGIILLGNESKGISKDFSPYITYYIKIPRFGNQEIHGIDSLNVGMAASIIFSEFSRR